MRILITVNSEEARAFALNQPKLMIGTDSACDIIISTSGISRKHLLVTREGDRCFVTDQGTRTGTFLADQRLVPGQAVELPAMVPLKLGAVVSISLEHS